MSSYVLDKSYSDSKRWICIYPAYINSKKTLAEGRRIPKSKCVENPTYQEIRDVLDADGFKVGVENKVHPREVNKESVMFRGRIRVQLKNDDGTPVNPNYPTRDSILLHLCKRIPMLKVRIQKQGGADQAQNAGGGGGKRGKGKKGKR